ncbi:flagellar hook protein FlgE [Candidatus Latescibacterota bacterium]
MSERAMYTAISGLRNQQVQMDIISNNIANSGTLGYKKGRTTFKETFSELLQGASRPPGGLGGVNPLQVGSGSSVGAIDNIMSQGSIQSTGNMTDMAIRGDGFFVISDGQRDFFTRAGAFQWDSEGRLVLPSNGMTVQGRFADANGQLDEGSALGDVVVPFGTVIGAQATTTVGFVGNLDVADPDGSYSTSVRVFDSLGNPHTMTLTFIKNATTANSWDWSVSLPSPATIENGGSGTITFDDQGALSAVTYEGGAAALTFDPQNGAETPVSITLDFGTIGETDGIGQFSSDSTVVAREQDGYSSGVLDSISIDNTGTIAALFTNGTSQTVAQLVLATFNNPSGMMRLGENVFDTSANSGMPIYGLAGTSINSVIVPGAVEMSNVDIAEEFTNMIIAQRSFQANARTVTTSDELMQETVNIKR